MPGATACTCLCVPVLYFICRFMCYICVYVCACLCFDGRVCACTCVCTAYKCFVCGYVLKLLFIRHRYRCWRSPLTIVVYWQCEWEREELTEQVSGICPLRLWKSFVMSKNLERSNKRHSCVALWESMFEGSLTHTMDERSGCLCLCWILSSVLFNICVP